jgi:hypothetical protein
MEKIKGTNDGDRIIDSAVSIETADKNKKLKAVVTEKRIEVRPKGISTNGEKLEYNERVYYEIALKDGELNPGDEIIIKVE